MVIRNKISKAITGILMSSMLFNVTAFSSYAGEAVIGEYATEAKSGYKKNAIDGDEENKNAVTTNVEANIETNAEENYTNPNTMNVEHSTFVHATETQDGIVVGERSDGKVVEYFVGGTHDTSAYAVFNDNAIEKVRSAASGATVKIETNIWTSFSDNVMECIAEKREVNVEIIYKMDDQYYMIKIPAGAEVPTHVEYAGFDGYLAGLYGKTKL